LRRVWAHHISADKALSNALNLTAVLPVAVNPGGIRWDYRRAQLGKRWRLGCATALSTRHTGLLRMRVRYLAGDLRT